MSLKSEEEEAKLLTSLIKIGNTQSESGKSLGIAELKRLYLLGNNNPGFILTVLKNETANKLIKQEPDHNMLKRYKTAQVAMQGFSEFLGVVKDGDRENNAPLFVTLAKHYILKLQKQGLAGFIERESHHGRTSKPLFYYILKMAHLSAENPINKETLDKILEDDDLIDKFKKLFDKAQQELVREHIDSILEKIVNAGGVTPQNLDDLQSLQISAILKKDKDSQDYIKEFLRKYPEIYNAYHKHNIATLQPKVSGGDTISPLATNNNVRATVKPVHYLHDKIDIKHLNPKNGKLYNDHEIKEIIKSLHQNVTGEYFNDEGRLYTVIKLPTEDGKEMLCAIYDVLGEGGYAQVLLAQDLITGNWVAIKDFTIDPDDEAEERKQISTEIIALRETKKFLGTTEIKDTNDHHIYIAQQLAEGINLKNIVKNDDLFRMHIRPSNWVEFGSQLLLAYKEQIADVNYLHCDLDFENVLINLVTGKPYYIDMGMAARKNSDGTVIKSDWDGASKFTAPEVRKPNSNNEHVYDERSEVFSLGMILLKYYKFPHAYDSSEGSYLRHGVQFYQINESSPEMQRFNSPLLRDDLFAFLKKMVALKPSDRPSVAECIDHLSSFKTLTLLSSTIVKEIAIFDIDEYRRANKQQKNKIIERLREADEINLLDSGKLKNNFEYQFLADELQKAGVRVGQTLFAQPPTQHIATQLSLLKDIRNRIAKEHSGNIVNITYLTTETNQSEFTTQLEKIGVQHENIYHPGSQYYSPDIKKEIIEALDIEISRLANTYKGEDEQINLIFNKLVKLRNDLSSDSLSEVDIAKITKEMRGIRTDVDALEQKYHLESVDQDHSINEHDIDELIDLNTNTLFKKIECLEKDMTALENKFNEGNKALAGVINEIDKFRNDLREDTLNELTTETIIAKLADLQQKMYSDAVVRAVLKEPLSTSQQIHAERAINHSLSDSDRHLSRG